MAKDRIVIPGIGKDAARVIIDRMRAQEERIAILERTAGRAGVISSDTAAKPGEFLNIEAPSSEIITIVLPESTPARRNARVTLAFRNANPVRIVAVAGTVNGEAFATSNQVGTFDAVADGLSGWSVQLGMTSAGPSGGALDAEYVLGAAHASLPNGRVATDSTEVDAVLTTPNVISWALNVASVAFSKLANLTGLSVLGRAANSAGVMAAITATAANQKLVSNRTGTSLEWVSDLPAVFIDTVTGSIGTYDLPSTFRNGDTLRLTITGNTTVVGFTIGGAVPDEGTEFNLCLSDQSGGSAPGHTLTIPDAGGGVAQFRTPGQVQGTVPGPSYVMQSEEEGIRCAFQQGAWRIIGGTAAQAITGAIEVSAGNGSTRTSIFATAASGAGLTGGGTAILAVGGSTSITVNANDIQRAALTGAITAAANSNATAFGVLAAKSVLANATNASAVPAALAGSAALQHLRVNSANNALEWATLSGYASTSITYTSDTFQRAALTGDVTASANSNATTIANDAVTDAKLRNSGALSVIGRSANSSGDPADISATAASGAVLRESGSVLGFGTVATAGIADAAVTLAKQANLAAGTVIGRQVDASTGVPVALTGDEQGENLRRFNGLVDTTSSGTVATFAITNVNTQVRFNIAAAVTLAGMTATSATFGKTIELTCESGMAGSVTIAHESASAGAANERFRTPGGRDLVLLANESCIATYWDNRWRVTAIGRLVRHDSLGSIASTGEAVTFAKYISFSATGVTGTMIDVTVWNADAPFALRIVRAELRVSTAVGATVAALRTAAGGGGSVVLPDATVGTQTFVTAATGVFEDNAVATATVAAAGSVFLNIDRAIAGELVLYCVRT